MTILESVTVATLIAAMVAAIVLIASLALIWLIKPATTEGKVGIIVGVTATIIFFVLGVGGV